MWSIYESLRDYRSVSNLVKTAKGLTPKIVNIWKPRTSKIINYFLFNLYLIVLKMLLSLKDLTLEKKKYRQNSR